MCIRDRFTGESAGVQFVDGVGHTDDVARLAYFRTAGYEVVEDDKPKRRTQAKSDN